MIFDVVFPPTLSNPVRSIFHALVLHWRVVAGILFLVFLEVIFHVRDFTI